MDYKRPFFFTETNKKLEHMSIQGGKGGAAGMGVGSNLLKPSSLQHNSNTTHKKSKQDAAEKHSGYAARCFLTENQLESLLVIFFSFLERLGV